MFYKSYYYNKDKATIIIPVAGVESQEGNPISNAYGTGINVLVSRPDQTTNIVSLEPLSSVTGFAFDGKFSYNNTQSSLITIPQNYSNTEFLISGLEINLEETSTALFKCQSTTLQKIIIRNCKIHATNSINIIELLSSTACEVIFEDCVIILSSGTLVLGNAENRVKIKRCKIFQENPNTNGLVGGASLIQVDDSIINCSGNKVFVGDVNLTNSVVYGYLSDLSSLYLDRSILCSDIDDSDISNIQNSSIMLNSTYIYKLTMPNEDNITNIGSTIQKWTDVFHSNPMWNIEHDW